MGAENSVQRDGKSQEDASTSASAAEQSAEVKLLQEEGGALDAKTLQKNGQISSMTSLNGHSEDNTLSEVGQPDAVSQKEEATENMVTTPEEVAPQVNGEKVEKESPDANDISAVEETAGEEKPDDANEVGFKKIFRFVGFKFTLKKDKSEEKDPVKLLNVKDKDEEKVSDEPAKEEEETAAAEEKSTAEEKEADTEAPTLEAGVEDTTDKAETTDAPAEGSAAENTEEAVKEEGAEASQEATLTMSPLKKLFSTGLFSNLRKKTSIKKTKDEEDKEAAAEEKTEETAAEVEEKEVTVEEETPATSEEEKSMPKEEAPVTPEEAKSEATPESETPAPAAATTEESKQEEEKAEASAVEEKAPAEVTTEAELLSSQEKVKPQGSPLKKLFTGAGLKKLSTKKQKTKKDTESKLTESGEQAAEQLQSSTDSAEAPKAESGPSSPEESGEHVIAVEVTQNESSQEADAEVTSDGEKKKEGIIAWSSFKRLVTPKKLVKRSSDSEDEATGEKPAKSATLSSSESAPLADKSVEEEAKEEKPTEEEPKTENTEKLVSSTEEPKKKMDTSVSWEALMCMGGTKKRTRRTSDSDDEETKVEEEAAAVETVVEEEEEAKTEADAVDSQITESEAEVVSSPEPVSSAPDRESTWDTLKRMVMPKNKAKVEEKPEDNGNQVQSDSEAPKDESSFSLRKFFPGLRRKKVEKQDSTEQGEEDSDTPAVVPLSEYDDQVEATQEAPAESAVVDSAGSSEDRAPSWISATIEDAQHDQLSDIPEEAENAATPKSADTDLADDDIQDDAAISRKALGGMGRRLSTAEVASVTPAPNAEATIVPQESTTQCATEVMEAAEVHVCEISPQTSVAVEDVPLNVASEKTEFEPQTETAESKTNTILQVHACDEAMAICTGLGTKTIAKVALEKPAVPLIEDMAVVLDPLSTEVLVEEIPAAKEQATAAEDLLEKAQVQEVETTDLAPCVDDSVVESVDLQTAAESHEPEIEKIGVITTTLEESLVLQSTTVAENSPKAEIINPIAPTSETAVCAQSVEVSEPKVEIKESKMDMEQLVAATEENAPVKEVVQVVTEELASTVCESAKASITEETEPDIPVILPSEEVPVITQTVVLTSSNAESDQVATSEVAIQVTEIKEEGKVVETLEVTSVQVLETDISAEREQVASETTEAQGMVIAQAVIKDAVDKIKDMPEPKKPAAPTSTIPETVQAVAKIEEEIVVLAESPIITDTPVPAVCEQPLHVATQLVDTLEIEVTESLDSAQQEEDKKAIDGKASEETVVLEEVMECQTGEELDQAEKEQSKEEAEKQKPGVEQAAKEVEETKPEAPSENKESEIHVPAQVVLQIAQVVEEALVEEEAIEEFDSNGPVDENTSVKAESHANKLATLTEEASEVPSQVTEAATSQPDTEKTSSEKCAEVMAQVIEVIEEAVKEIEPVSTEITAAS